MNRRYIFFGILFFLILFFIFGNISWKNKIVRSVNIFLSGNFFDDELNALKSENQALKAQILELNNKIIPLKSDAVIGQVFSSYPFNNKNLLSINVGENQGIKELMPVTLEGYTLVGQISKVFKNYSLVKTIFSPDWQIPVRIGEKKIPALLVGGPNLKLTMIVNDKPNFENQPIFAASQDLPYGLNIGAVTDVQNNSDTGVFQEANIDLDYDFDNLTELSVLLWTAD